MEYKETINKGLKRSYEVTVPSSEVEAQVNNKILEIQKTIKKDEIFNSRNLWVRRPGIGDFSAEEYETLFGKKASRDISKNQTLKRSDVA